MTNRRNGLMGPPVIALGVRFLRISRTGPRSVEVIADVRYRETSRGPVQRKSILAAGTLPPDAATPGLRQVLLDQIFVELGRSRMVGVAQSAHGGT